MKTRVTPLPSANLRVPFRRAFSGRQRRRSCGALRTGRPHVGLCVLAVLLTACAAGATSTDGTAASTAGVVSASAAPSVVAVDPSGSPSATAMCEDLEATGAAIVRTVADLSRLVGTQKDATALLGDVAGFAPALGGLVPTCAPDAVDAMWRFLTWTEEMRQHFSSGTGKTEMGATKLGLIAVRAQGADLYQRLGLDGAGWSAVPANARLGCRDLKRIGASITWEVRHLANLIGSDNVKDSQGYLVDVAGLTSPLTELVDECRPKAASAMAEFASAVERLSATYQPGTNAAAVAADKGALGELRAKGISLYTQLGIDAASWKVIPVTER